MLNVCMHCALAPVLRFLRFSQRRVSLRSLVREVLRVGCRFSHRLSLPPVGAVAVDADFLSVQKFSERLAVVHVGRCK